MKKLLVLLIAAHCSAVAFGQSEMYYTKTGSIEFESSVPSFEEVKAKSENVSAILRADGSFVSLAQVKSFRFKISLMEEHFNENYMESGKYPTTTFKGKLAGFSLKDLSENAKEYSVQGKLKIHGIEQDISAKCTLTMIDGKINMTTEFTTKPELFGIEIPKIVRNKIAKEVIVKASYTLNKK